MKKTILTIGVMLLLNQLFAQKNNIPPQLGKDKLEDVIAAMTREEKVYLLMGLGEACWKNPSTGEKTVIIEEAAGRTWGIDRLGIKPAVFSDGPAGLRIKAHPANATQNYYCTAFPTGTAMASTWNVDLTEKVGEAMGNEVLEYGVDLLLAPGVNIHRNPLCGRNFEYYSEDPLIAGKIGAALIRGVQSNNVGTAIKHFAVNNIETNRTSVNAVVSQRALREIYLRPFEIAVKDANPWTVMTSYNRLNGFYTSENRDLISTILRDEWGFRGLVMSDWYGGADAVAQMNAGNDLIMPGCHQRIELLNALDNKTLDEKVVDQNLTRILTLIMKTPRFKGYAFSSKPDLKAHADIARNAASEGIVLLKNENNALPFKGVKRVALFGKTSYSFIAGGTGSGAVNYDHAVSIKEGVKNCGFKIVQPLSDIYRHFIDTILLNSKDADKRYVVDFHPELQLTKAQIMSQVELSDVAVLTIGRNAGEGADRSVEDFSLTDTEKNLIKEISDIYHQAGKKVVVVLNIGGVIETADWRDYPDAVLLAWQTGQQGANALADILSGKVSPSGKLPMSFPLSYGDVPSAKSFPGEPKNNPADAFYEEDIYVGYRYYETFGVPTAYEFGYGLSYTQFEYSGIKLSSNTFTDQIKVTVNVRNVGKMIGKDVVELYLSAPKSEIEKPEQELKGFQKTRALKPGESQQLTFMLNNRDLASFWSGISAWVANKGSYEVRLGASSKDIRQKVSFELPETIVVEKEHNVLYPNRVIKKISSLAK